MVKFLRLTKVMINTSYINYIKIHDSSYTIYTINNDITGICIFGSGSVSSHEYEYKICRNKDPKDYSIVTEWIYKLDT